MNTQYPQSIETQAVKDYLISLINPLNVENTASGTNSVTINEPNGVAVFSSAANGNSYTSDTVNNSLVTSANIIEWGLQYTPGTGLPAMGSYQIGTGTITFNVYNGSATSTDSNLIIHFRIIA
jgi:hypothetical protein